MQEVKPIIPEQEQGASTDIETCVDTHSAEKAHQLFVEASKRLLDVNNWHNLCGAVTATFQLTDANGRQANRDAQVNDHFKIDIPGPGSNTGDGFDWVKIEAIENHSDGQNETTGIRVRPATNPLNSNEDVAHFFSEEATSSFVVKRVGNTICAEVHGRNEKPNTAAEAIVDKTRNAMIALGAMLGFSAGQWKSLVNGILDKK